MNYVAAVGIVVLVLVGLTACSSQSINTYQRNSPALVPEEFFTGKLTAHGVIKNRGGEVTRYFNADINAHWDKGVGTLEEKFLFNDGEVQYRTWTLTPAQASGGVKTYTATAGDVVGVGKGSVAGNAFNLAYVLGIQYKGSALNLSVDDWMWLVDKNTIINESTLSKFGFRVGTIQLTIIKTP